METNMSKIIVNISRILAKDYFIYFNSKEMLEYLYNNTRIDNHNYIPYALLKNNENFQKAYMLNYTKYIESYSNERNKVGKCKYIIKNVEFNNLIEEMSNLQYI